MKRKDWLRILGLAIVLGLTAMAGACNDKLDDEDESPNLLKVTSITPQNICIDGDGEFVDQDGDGTTDGQFFVDVLATFTISSTLKNANAASPFNDVVLESYTVSYDNGAPSRGGGLTVVIPAGGSTSVGAVVVNAGDIGANFGIGSRGTATIRFFGEDVAGKPASTTARMAFESVDICL